MISSYAGAESDNDKQPDGDERDGEARTRLITRPNKLPPFPAVGVCSQIERLTLPWKGDKLVGDKLCPVRH